MTPAFWRRWHRWIGFPASIFLLFAATTGIVIAFTEFFGEAEAKREALRDVVSSVTLQSPTEAYSAPLERALHTAASAAGAAPVDRITMELKGDAPTITVFLGKPTGGEDRKLVLDAQTGALLSSEAYADKPFLYRLHSGEAFGDGGLVLAMFWGLSLIALTISGLLIYWRMRRGDATGWRRIFW